MYTEIAKLHIMLTEENIPHTVQEFPVPFFNGFQILLYADEMKTIELDDAVCHTGSRGFSSGLLETMCLNGCEGHETAEEVFKGWKKMYEKAQKILDKTPKV